MASLESLPDELLVEIIEIIQVSSESSHNLFNLLCVSTRLYRVTLDTLYMAPCLLKPKPSDTQSWDERRKHQIPALLRTIIDKPKFAKRIYRLHLTTVRYGPLERADTIKDFDLDNERVKNLPHLTTGWEIPVRAGSECAIAGLIVALTPSLKHLSIGNYRMDETPAQKPMPFQPVLRSSLWYSNEWFGFQRFPRESSTIAGLKHLESIKCNSRIPWAIVSQETLTSIDFFCPGLYTRQAFPLDRDATNQSVTHLKLHRTNVMLFGLGRRDTPIVGQTRRYTQCFTGLRTVHLVIAGILDHGLCKGYDVALRHIVAPELRTLIIDTQDVWASSVCQWVTSPTSARVFPMTSLMQFPKLRRIVAQQEAFMINQDTETCVLPDSIEIVEVIDPTDSFLRLLDTIANDDGLPKLNTVLVWQDFNEQNTDEKYIMKTLPLSDDIIEWSNYRNVFIGLGLEHKGWSDPNPRRQALKEIKVRTNTEPKKW